jgi:hypothetical protein
MNQDIERRLQALGRLAGDRGATAGEKAAARAAARRLRARLWFRSPGHKEALQALAGHRNVQVPTKPKARPRLGQQQVEIVQGFVGGVVVGALTLLASMPVAVFAEWLLDLGQQSTLAVGAVTWFAFDIAIIAGLRRRRDRGFPLVARSYICGRLTFTAILILVAL